MEIQLADCSWQQAEYRRQKTEDRGQNSALRIAKPGTRPKGGSPKDNFEIEKSRAGHCTGRKRELINERLYGGYGDPPYDLNESGETG